MSVRNLLLLSLLGVAPDPDPFDDWAEALGSDDQLLFGMHLAKSRQQGHLAMFLAEESTVDVASLSRWCLFIGLTEDPSYGLDLFEVVRKRYPLSAPLWVCLATLQAANGFNIQAARSLAVHAALTGRDAPVVELPLSDIAPRRAGTGMRFMAGDASQFSSR